LESAFNIPTIRIIPTNMMDKFRDVSTLGRVRSLDWISDDFVTGSIHESHATTCS
jgi:hypothetical protein